MLGGGVGLPDNITLTNVVVSNNTAGYSGLGENGGAMDISSDGTYTFTGCTFSNNTAFYHGAPQDGGGAGGAFYVDNANSSGNMTITNCTFTGNTSQNGGGGAVYSVMGLGDTTTISGSTFTGNSALDDAADGGAQGGAIHADGDMTISNSRIVGNSSADGPANGTGLFAANTAPLGVVATDNWWGCNGGPGASGCDTAVEPSGDNGPLTINPWLVLSISASSTQIDPSGTSTLTADLTHNSNNVGGFSVPNGTAVAFGGTLGTDSPTSTTLTSGQATSLFTAGTTAGHGSGTATVDNQTVSVTIEILDTVSFNTSPVGLSYTVDSNTYNTPQTFHWVVGSSNPVSTTSPQSGPTGSQYVFGNWSDGGAISHSVTAPVADTTYTVNFNTQYQLTTQASPPADGSVTPASGGYYDPSASVPVTATPNAGFQFDNWTSSGGTFDSTTAASTNFRMPSAPATVTGNFSLIVVAAGTTTTVQSNNNPSFTTAPGNSVTFTAAVTSTSIVNEGTVTFTDGVNNLTCSGGNPVAVSSGQAQCTTSFTAEGAHAITASYNGTVDFLPSSGNVSQVVNNHTVQTGNQSCNPGPITIPSTAGAATPYPSNIFVTGLSGNIGQVTVTLNNISSSNIPQTDLLLVGPTEAEIVPFASVGDGSSISGVNITLDDAAAGLIPGGSPLTTRTYKPTSITGSTSLVFPAPAPTVVAGNYAATDGSATLTSTFQNTPPNGTWALYAMDNSGSGAASIGGGWCVNISPATTQITITTSPANLLVSVDGGTFTAAPLVENWVSGSSHTIATTSPQAGGTGVQYVWNNWSDAGAISHSTTVPSTATTYTANFNTQYQLTTQASPPADGSVAPASGGYYAASAVVPVTATANAGFQFTNWTSTGGTFDSATAASTNFHMPAAPTTVTANFSAAGPLLSVTPNSIDFGVVYLFNTQSQNVTVKNIGTSTVTISKVSLTLGAGTSRSVFKFTNSCPKMLTVGNSCTITINFNATAVGTPSATLNVADNASGSPQQVSLSATVINPKAQLSTKSLGFSTVRVGQSRTKNVTLSNPGKTTLTITSIGITGADPGDFTESHDCLSSLPAGGKCTIAVTFAPTATGPRSAELTVMDNAQVGEQDASLSGKGQ